MKKFFKILLIVASIILGLYVGIWLMLAGGIIQIINSINPLDGTGIAIGIIRVLFCEIAGLIPIAGISIAGILD